MRDNRVKAALAMAPAMGTFFQVTTMTPDAHELVASWGEPDETRPSAWNLLFWMIPLAPSSIWRWTGFDRDVEVTVWRPLAYGYLPAVWMCDVGPLRVR